MKNLVLLIALSLFGWLSSCSSAVDAGKINLENWKSDRYGCKGLRMQEMEEFRIIKNQFLGNWFTGNGDQFLKGHSININGELNFSIH